jgi:DNA mismatch endonuclease (patch repair protein)
MARDAVLAERFLVEGLGVIYPALKSSQLLTRILDSLAWLAFARFQMPFPEVPEQVRRRMSRIRKTGSQPEVRVRQLVHRLGYGFRINRRDFPGSPDLVFIGRKKAIFVHGCFWHQHGCSLTGKMPQTRVEYWVPKLKRNVERDQEAQRRLVEMGYSVLTIWECEVGGQGLLERLARFLEA